MTLQQLKTALQQGADPNAVNDNGNAPLNFFLRSTYADKKDYMEALLAAKADPNTPSENGMTPLHWLGLIHGGGEKDLDIARMLLKAGADINARDKNGATPLHVATEAWLNSNKPNVMMFLIEEGADVDATNDAGKNPLQIAVEARKTPEARQSVTDFFNTLVRKGRESARRQNASAAEAQKQLRDKAAKVTRLKK